MAKKEETNDEKRARLTAEIETLEDRVTQRAAQVSLDELKLKRKRRELEALNA